MRQALPRRDDEHMNTTTGAKYPSASPALTSSAGEDGTPAGGPRPAGSPWLGIAVVAAVAFGLEMAVSARYGYVRDELYFLAAGQHLAFGYVDQPPLTPWLARVSALATGNTLVGLRVLPALGLAALVVLTAAMSRLLGAGRTGQLLAALATATCGEYLGAMHELTTTVPDFLFWAVTLLLVMRLLTSQDPRWWVAIGGCIGAGSGAWCAAATCCSAAWSPRRWRHLISSGRRRMAGPSWRCSARCRPRPGITGPSTGPRRSSTPAWY
jgi:hypothetical protein